LILSDYFDMYWMKTNKLIKVINSLSVKLLFFDVLLIPNLSIIIKHKFKYIFCLQYLHKSTGLVYSKLCFVLFKKTISFPVPLCRLFMDAKRLKCLRVGHNRLLYLPAEVDSLFLEELQIQHNQIAHLPPDFLQKANKYFISYHLLTSILSCVCNRELGNSEFDSVFFVLTYSETKLESRT